MRSATASTSSWSAILTLNIATVFLGIGVWWAISLTGLQIPSPASVVASGIDGRGDRKSTRLNSSHVAISYAVFCLKKKNTNSYKEREHISKSYSKKTQT